MEKINAFILAAGLGERLRPITDQIPKPLLPVLGKPIIEIVLEKILSLPVCVVAINSHYKADMIKDWADQSTYNKKIRIFYENPVLGTGGALKNAASLLCKSGFIVHNSDILSNIDLEFLLNKHASSRNIATLAVMSRDNISNVWIDRLGNVQYVGDNKKEITTGLCKVAFTGIAVYSPEFLEFLPLGNSSVITSWMKAISSGRSIGTADFTGTDWSDIGNPEAYAAAVFDELINRGESVYVHPSFVCDEILVDGFTAIEKGASAEKNALLKNSLLLHGASIHGESFIKNSIAGPGYLIQFDEKKVFHPASVSSPLLPENSSDAYITLIGSGGSDRNYYRVKSKESSIVLMLCSKADVDFARHIGYTRFLKSCSVPVPEVIMVDASEKHALFEDLGDLSLYSWLACRRSPEKIEAIYQKVLDIIVIMHTTVTERISECPILQARIFDYEHLRWETDYFLERYVKQTKEARISYGKSLYAEFDALAKTVDSFQKRVLHRDFQSQNIMITSNNTPHLIDYQGARIGPPAYDIASILWDPYYRINEHIRERLIAYYIAKMKIADSSFDEINFISTLLPCRLQRHMQALGAYGFLSAVKGKKYFLKYAPLALEYLKQESDEAKDEYPALYDLIKQL